MIDHDGSRTRSKKPSEQSLYCTVSIGSTYILTWCDITLHKLYGVLAGWRVWSHMHVRCRDAPLCTQAHVRMCINAVPRRKQSRHFREYIRIFQPDFGMLAWCVQRVNHQFRLAFRWYFFSFSFFYVFKTKQMKFFLLAWYVELSSTSESVTHQSDPHETVTHHQTGLEKVDKKKRDIFRSAT